MESIQEDRRRIRWRPNETFDTGILKTVKWYLEHKEWVEQVKSGEYRWKPEELIK